MLVIKEVLFNQLAHVMFIYIFPPFINQLESEEPCTWPSSRRGSGFQWAKAREGEKHVEFWNPGSPQRPPGVTALHSPLGYPSRRGASP